MYLSDVPRSPEQAELYRYGQWAGEAMGRTYDPKRCAMEIGVGGRSCLFKQCGRKPGHGPASLYCKQHAKQIGDWDKRQTGRAM